MSNSPTSVRLDKELAAKLATLSAATDRSKTWHIEQAVRRYVEDEIQFLEAVDEGLRDLETGNVVDHAVIVQEARHRRERRATGTP